MKLKTLFIAISVLSVSVLFVNCGKDDDTPKLNIFSISDDIELGEQTKAEIEADEENYPILDSNLYPEAYAHLYRIRDNILNSGEIKYQDEFQWYVRIINDDSTVNAFALPGGFMYFYTGIIKSLDNEAQFAGVMAHEMAHIDRRHSTNHLTKAYGVSVLLGVLAGDDPGLLAQIAASLLSLQFTRSNEYEADEYAVNYVYETDYHAPSLGDFFEKLEGMSSTPSFLSTHPSPEDRLEMINQHWTELGGKSGETFDSKYTDFKNTLP